MTKLGVSQRYKLKYGQENDEAHEERNTKFLRQFREALIRRGKTPEEIEREVEELASRLAPRKGSSPS